MAAGTSTFRYRGWDVVRLTVPPLEIDVLPDKGGDILALRWLPRDLNLLWTSPWGLRERDARSTARTSIERFLESYPGGWQTIFPNGGEPAVENGVEWGFHGEACVVPWRILDTATAPGRAVVELETQLSSAPFSLRRRLELTPHELHVEETAHNRADSAVETMWSHHPAFGAPFLSGSTRIECDGGQFIADAERDVPAGDLAPGAASSWPHGRTRAGELADLQILPGEDSPADRFGYVTGFRDGFAALTNNELRLRTEMRWDTSIFPHAWYWVEAHATKGHPWHGRAYVFAFEPASSYPGHGVASVRTAGGDLVRFEPGERKTATISVRVLET